MQERLVILDQLLSTIEPGIISNECIEKLSILLPESLLLAALDLIDRGSVIKYTTAWGRSYYEVLGSTAIYSVFPSLGNFAPNTPAYCTCPAFAYAVLMSKTHVACKHVLATRIAQHLARCVERPVNEDELAAIFIRQCSLNSSEPEWN